MIPVSEPCLGKEELKNVINCIKTNWISSLGEYVNEFEKKFSKYIGCKYGVSTSSGTTALHLALKTIGIRKGDEVIVPTLTFAATAHVVVHCNAKPIFVDSDPITWNINPEKIEEKITKKTKAIIPVHLYGHPCDLDPILGIAEDYDLFIIEDAAEAHGAEYKKRKVGSFGDIGCFSFFGNKIITTGEGGICVTDNEEIVEKMRILNYQGMDPNKKYWHPFVGFNYRLTNLQSAIGLAQLKKINKFIKIKRENTKIYNSLLRNVEGISLPPNESWAKNVYWMYCILLENNFRVTRDKLMKELKENGIDTRPLFYPLHIMPPFYTEEKFPVSEELSRKGLNLPSSVKLKKSEIKFITEIITKG